MVDDLQQTNNWQYQGILFRSALRTAIQYYITIEGCGELDNNLFGSMRNYESLRKNLITFKMFYRVNKGEKIKMDGGYVTILLVKIL